MHKAALYELHYIAYRIYEALRHYPKEADKEMQTRWEHGLAREMWNTIGALGILTAYAAKYKGEDAAKVPDMLLELLPRLEWTGLTIGLDLNTMDRQALVAAYKPTFDFSDGPVGGFQWWTWPQKDMGKSQLPSWWTSPSRCVPRPMPAFATDLIPAASQAEEIAGICRARLQSIDCEIKEEKWCTAHLQTMLQTGMAVYPPVSNRDECGGREQSGPHATAPFKGWEKTVHCTDPDAPSQSGSREA
ncbi:hypothetical protein L227DRAFT_608807 [Lentinus tigrinus ALCF2SS1-6]|uniref:Uncharacterized protein n=1 Tax=Lentinus tigrinus ALCF2SS1-6 TaxID=1328759 RepID=A0A5C2SK22_9APHY|nr:hypothetical protein L227DRAFT_608807 [Lentinus tigrinus ALCF2SS1-6]